MSANAYYLKKHGWVMVYEKKHPTYGYQLWSKPNTEHQRLTQSEALAVERRPSRKLHPDIGGRRVEPKPPME